MDNQQFDTFIRALATGTTRRGALGILAGLLSLQFGEAAAKRRHRRKRDRVRSAAQKDHKVTICHRTGSEKNPFVIINVDESAIPAHEAHGDIIDPDFENDPDNCGDCAVSCDDDDRCTTDTCVEGKCVNTAVDCDDDNECTDDSCDPDTGCVNTPVADGTACADDEDICTSDSCQGGTCVHDRIAGCCVEDADCPEGEICSEGKCIGDPACRGATCRTFTPCGAVAGCVCLSLSGGGAGAPGLCGVGATPCSAVGPCGANNSCPAGSICVVDSCCPVPSCFPLSQECAPAAAPGAAPRASDRSGRTFGHR